MSAPPLGLDLQQCLVEFSETVNEKHRSDLHDVDDDDLELVWKDPNGYDL